MKLSVVGRPPPPLGEKHDRYAIMYSDLHLAWVSHLHTTRMAMVLAKHVLFVLRKRRQEWKHDSPKPSYFSAAAGLWFDWSSPDPFYCFWAKSDNAADSRTSNGKGFNLMLGMYTSSLFVAIEIRCEVYAISTLAIIVNVEALERALVDKPLSKFLFARKRNVTEDSTLWRI